MLLVWQRFTHRLTLDKLSLWPPITSRQSPIQLILPQNGLHDGPTGMAKWLG